MSTSTSSKGDPAARAGALEAELRQTRLRMAKLERLAEAVVAADCWDHAIYETPPDDGWLAVDRDDWANLLNAVSQIDRWRPWEG